MYMNVIQKYIYNYININELKIDILSDVYKWLLCESKVKA